MINPMASQRGAQHGRRGWRPSDVLCHVLCYAVGLLLVIGLAQRLFADEDAERSLLPLLPARVRAEKIRRIGTGGAKVTK
jgi:hypothetical protein